MNKSNAFDTKFVRSEIKAASDGSFEGLLSPYNVVDQGGDMVMPGAYSKTLSDRGNKRVLLWQHMSDCPIGELTLQDKSDGLYAKGQLLLEIPEAKKAYQLIKSGIVSGLSIGFRSMNDGYTDKGVRQLKEIALFEGSIVTFPMAEEAQISSVKNVEQETQIRAALRDLKAAVVALKN
jgi:uncharacterized protein